MNVRLTISGLVEIRQTHSVFVILENVPPALHVRCSNLPASCYQLDSRNLCTYNQVTSHRMTALSYLGM
jgi:hypothetical protein